MSKSREPRVVYLSDDEYREVLSSMKEQEYTYEEQIVLNARESWVRENWRKKLTFLQSARTQLREAFEESNG